MQWFMIVVAIVIGLSGCKSSPPPPPPPPVPAVGILSWIPGECKDLFFVYQQLGDGWISIGDTINTRFTFELEPGEEKVVTVSGVCGSGPNAGEWMSSERVTAKR